MNNLLDRWTDAPMCECGVVHNHKEIDMTWDEYNTYDHEEYYIARADCQYINRAAITILYENDRFLVYQDKETHP